MSESKPTVVYLHRYPPELEAYQWPAFRELVEALSPAYEMVYACMAPAQWKRDADLRRNLRMLELPFSVDQSSGRDKWFKTLRWYLHLGRLLKQIRALNPALIICKETLPLIPGRVVNLGIPTLIETNDWWWSILIGHWRWGRWLADRIESWEARSWDRPHVRATVTTQAEKRLLAAKGLGEARIAVISAPQNRGVFRPLDPPPSRAELGLEPDLKYFAI
jgi:hypothetical protein